MVAEEIIFQETTIKVIKEVQILVILVEIDPITIEVVVVNPGHTIEVTHL